MQAIVKSGIQKTEDRGTGFAFGYAEASGGRRTEDGNRKKQKLPREIQRISGTKSSESFQDF